MLKIEFSKKAGKFLSKCENELYNRIIKKIKSLGENPFPQDCKKLEGKIGRLFRIRVGDYRIIYEIINKDLILIADINKRSLIYK